LVRWLRDNGATVIYRQEVEAIDVQNGRAVAVRTKKGLTVACDWLLANVTPWALRALLGQNAPTSLAREVATRPATWGAFTLYLGLDEKKLPAVSPAHHQVIVDPTKPLGEGNSVFISLAEAGEDGRAPVGKRAATLSTHTAIAPWWELRRAKDEGAYLARREAYRQRLLAAAEQAIPGISAASELVLPGTPVTFAFYTRRPAGMVGGFAQASLFSVRGPATGIANLKLVGDSIFPGQSTAGVTLGALRVADQVIAAARQRLWPAFFPSRRAFWQGDPA
jgi:phytoene dehydrogenase-like protein